MADLPHIPRFIFYGFYLERPFDENTVLDIARRVFGEAKIVARHGTTIRIVATGPLLPQHRSVTIRMGPDLTKLYQGEDKELHISGTAGPIDIDFPVAVDVVPFLREFSKYDPSTLVVNSHSGMAGIDTVIREVSAGNDWWSTTGIS